MNLQDLDRTLFIAEIGANHDGQLDRALKLIRLAAAAGADVVKFQHYRADTLASEYGFEQLASLAHYSDNPHRVFRKYETPWKWTPFLAETCRLNGVEFMSTPYDLVAVDHLNPYVKAWKIGSGDITYQQLIEKCAGTNKPILLATGASHIDEIVLAVSWTGTSELCIMQCNTNYTGSEDNLQYVNLRTLWHYISVTGLSDHSRSMIPVLGAVALGAKVIEKHFTDGESESPDNSFALRPDEWAAMVGAVRQLEAALGDGAKRVEPNEVETVVLQRRCLRAARDLSAGTILTADDIVALRPAPEGSIAPYNIDKVLGSTLAVDMKNGEEFESLSFIQDFSNDKRRL